MHLECREDGSKFISYIPVDQEIVVDEMYSWEDEHSSPLDIRYTEPVKNTVWISDTWGRKHPKEAKLC